MSRECLIVKNKNISYLSFQLKYFFLFFKLNYKYQCFWNWEGKWFITIVTTAMSLSCRWKPQTNMTNIDRVKFQTFANLYPWVFLFLHSLAPFCCFPLSIPRFMLKKLHLFMLYTSHCILFLITYFFLPKHLPQTINLPKMSVSLSE